MALVPFLLLFGLFCRSKNHDCVVWWQFANTINNGPRKSCLIDGWPHINWSKLSDVILAVIYHNGTSKQLFSSKHPESGYNKISNVCMKY